MLVRSSQNPTVPALLLLLASASNLSALQLIKHLSELDPDPGSRYPVNFSDIREAYQGLSKKLETQKEINVAIAKIDLAKAPPQKTLYIPWYFSLICPLTGHWLKDPVIIKSGKTYERSAITAWLSEYPVDPLTGELLYDLNMQPNRSLKAVIDAFGELKQEAVQDDFSKNLQILSQSIRDYRQREYQKSCENAVKRSAGISFLKTLLILAILIYTTGPEKVKHGVFILIGHKDWIPSKNDTFVKNDTVLRTEDLMFSPRELSLFHHHQDDRGVCDEAPENCRLWKF